MKTVTILPVKNKFVIIDTQTNKKWANEKFISIAEAVSFCDENKLQVIKEDKKLTITDRQIANLREQISIIQRNITLFNSGKNESRLNTALNTAIDIDTTLCSIK